MLLHNPRLSLGVLVVAILVGCADDQSTNVTLSVLRMEGVEGAPLAGEQVMEPGAVVNYAFSAMSGYEELQVLLDGEPVAPQGVIHMDRAHTLIATAWPRPTAPVTAAGRLVENIYVGASPALAYKAMVRQLGEALLAGDAAALEDMRTAEYYALLKVGPEGMERVAEALAGQTFELVGSLGSSGILAESARQSMAADQGQLFTEDTTTPTTVIFVNGILNTRSSARSSAEAILQMTQDSGFASAVYVADARNPRPGSPMRVMLHFNPIVDIQNPFRSCLAKLAWVFNVAGSAVPRESEQSWLAALWGLRYRLERANLLEGCTDLFSTNLRVVGQYLDANLGQLSAPSVNDLDLTELIENERSSSGGRNIIVIGHSHGSVIARSAIGRVAEPGEHMGCIGAISLGSPLGTQISWPRTRALHRIIAKGTQQGSWDLLFPLGGGNRADGVRSKLTDELDRDIAREGPGFWAIRQLQLHEFSSSYMGSRGLRSKVAAAFKDGYAVLEDECGGRLTGIVADLETGELIQGAMVQARLAGQDVGAPVQTSSTGRFTTPMLRPVLHDLIISAPGYDTVELKQRLVPFNTDTPAQAGPIYLAKKCDSANTCIMQGTYDVTYTLSGTSAGKPVSCAFLSQVTLTQTGSAYEGTITTKTYQQGCDTSDGSYVYWNAGTSRMAGTIQDGAIVFEHDADPVWNMTGTVFSNGFRAIEPAWRPGGFNVRVEMTASRISAGMKEGALPPSRGASQVQGEQGSRIGIRNPR